MATPTGQRTNDQMRPNSSVQPRPEGNASRAQDQRAEKEEHAHGGRQGARDDVTAHDRPVLGKG